MVARNCTFSRAGMFFTWFSELCVPCARRIYSGTTQANLKFNHTINKRIYRANFWNLFQADISNSSRFMPGYSWKSLQNNAEKWEKIDVNYYYIKYYILARMNSIWRQFLYSNTAKLDWRQKIILYKREISTRSIISNKPSYTTAARTTERRSAQQERQSAQQERQSALQERQSALQERRSAQQERQSAQQERQSAQQEEQISR